jgi:hypothetical protein
MCDCKKEKEFGPCFNAYEAMVRQSTKQCACKECNCEKTALQVQIEGKSGNIQQQVLKPDFK